MGGYVLFFFEIMSKICMGINEFMVWIDNFFLVESVFMKWMDWWLYGGLIWDVLLVEMFWNYVRNVKIVFIDWEMKFICVDVLVFGFDVGISVKVLFFELDVF